MKIAIVGAGLTGIATAYYLQKNGFSNIDIYEKSQFIGGLAGSIKLDNTYVEKYYHHIFTHDKYFSKLANELGLKDQIDWYLSSVGFFSEGTIHPFTTPLDLLKFKPLNMFNRIRLGLSSYFISKYKNIEKLESITTEEFLIKFVGKSGWKKIWMPMLRIKFGDNYNKIPAVWIWERIVQRFNSRKDAKTKEVLGYMKGGFNVFIQKLVDVITNNGASIQMNSQVTKILTHKNACKGICINDKEIYYDYVFFTAALPILLSLIKDLPFDYVKELKKVKYDACLVALLVLNNKLGDYYWLNISDNEIPFGGLIEHTNLVSSENYGGKTILYFSKYLNPEDSFLKLSSEELLSQYIEYLKKIYPKFTEDCIDKCFVFKDRYAQPIWPMSYSNFKPDYKTPVRGMYLANTSQIYPNDRGMNFSIKLAVDVTNAFINSIHH